MGTRFPGGVATDTRPKHKRRPPAWVARQGGWSGSHQADLCAPPSGDRGTALLGRRGPG
jgi:hypothetical protein